MRSDDLAFILFIVVAILAVVIVSVFLADWSCVQRGEVMNKNTRFEIPYGCHIEVEEGRYIPFDNYRELE